jgi:hypothetical protein
MLKILESLRGLAGIVINARMLLGRLLGGLMKYSRMKLL